MKALRPITSSMRGVILVEKKSLSAPRVKELLSGRKRLSARNNHGRITVRHRGGGQKQRLRVVDFKRYTDLSYGERLISEVCALEYDPARTAFLALLRAKNGKNPGAYSYIIAPGGVKVGANLTCSFSSQGSDMLPGDCMPLSEIRLGMQVHCIELKHGSGGILVRAAGSYATVMGHDSGNTILKLTSGEVRMIPSSCFATIGAVCNAEHKNENFGKAGRKRWMGIRPTVRGVAMNPIDHPHGGGEGKTSGGRHPVTPWGKSTKGKRTRHKKLASDRMIKLRRYGK